MQPVRMGSPGMAHPQQQMPGKQPPRMLLQQIQAARMNNSVKPGQPQSPVHGPQHRPSVSPQHHTKPSQQQLSNILQNQGQVAAPPPPPPPYPGPPPPYPGNNASQQGAEQVNGRNNTIFVKENL